MQTNIRSWVKQMLPLCILTFLPLSTKSQNIQLHYDFGRNIYSGEEAGRQKVTATLEQFKPDEWGSWFYFVDLDFNHRELMSAYTEIAREVNLSKNLPLAVHAEYDGGLASSIGSYQQAALLGLAYNGHNSDFTKTWSVQLLYKQYFRDVHDNRAYSSAQLTGVWGMHFLDRKLTFSGFIDFWRGQKPNGHGCLVILAEPQLWYNFNKHLSVGTEIEFSDNFVFNTNPASGKSFFCNPTAALKWNF